VLRGKLEVLEDYLPSMQEVPVTLKLLTDCLACCLRCHNAQEEARFDGLHARGGSREEEVLQHLHDDHQNLRMRLAVVHDLVSHPDGPPYPETLAQAQRFIRDLRSHLDRVEGLFPLLDKGAEGVEGGAPPLSEQDEEVECLGLA
jgi:hemerythrin-like domain-containing protein